MPDVNATEASRSFSRLLDEVEHDGASYRIVRRGRAIAQLSPVARCSGAEFKSLLGGLHVDAGWRDELSGLRELLEDRPRWS